MDYLKFEPKLTIPSITKTTYPKGLYAGAGFSTNPDIKLTLDYIKKDWLIGYEYNPILKTHGVRVAYRIF